MSCSPWRRLFCVWQHVWYWKSEGAPVDYKDGAKQIDIKRWNCVVHFFHFFSQIRNKFYGPNSDLHERILLHEILRIYSQPLVDIIRNQLIGNRKVESLKLGDEWYIFPILAQFSNTILPKSLVVLSNFQEIIANNYFLCFTMMGK